MIVMLAAVSTAGAEETVISNGQTIGGFSGSFNSMWVGRIYVPLDARRFVVTTSGGTGDCDLYIRRYEEDKASWDFRSQSNNNSERIALEIPAAGWWQIGLIGAGEFNGVTLHVQFDDPQARHPAQPQPVDKPQVVEALQVGGNDEFEPNSKRELAMQIFIGQPEQVHSLTEGDEDWIMFVPRQSGEYLLQITNVTADLDGEIWVQGGRDKEQRVQEFEIPRGRESEVALEVDANVGYFKFKIEADDDYNTGAYSLSIKQTRTAANPEPHVRRPDVFESDNRAEVAVGILDNTPQFHTIYPRDDEDWLVFAPDRTGEYVLKFSNVTTALEGELWVQAGDEQERRVDKFDVSRWGRSMTLRADQDVRYFKLRIRAEDDDDTGEYRLDVTPVKPAPAATTTIFEPTTTVYEPTTTIYEPTTTIVRSTVFLPILRIPTFYRLHSHYRHRYPCRRRVSSHYGRHSGRIVSRSSRPYGSVVLGSGGLRIGVGLGGSVRRGVTSGRSRGSSHHGHGHSRGHDRDRDRGHDRDRGRSGSRITVPTRTTGRTTIRTPGRTAGRTTGRTTGRTPSRTTVRTPTSTTPRATSRTPIRITPPTRTRTPSRTAIPTRSTTRTPNFTGPRTTRRTPTRTTVRTPTFTPPRTTTRTPTRITPPTRTRTPSRTAIPTRSTTRTPNFTGPRTTMRTPTRTTVRTPTFTPPRTTTRTPTRITPPTRTRTPSRTAIPTRSTTRTPTRFTAPSRSTMRTPTRSRTPIRTAPPTRSTTRTPVRPAVRTPAPARSRTTPRPPTRVAPPTRTRTPARTTSPTRSTVQTPSRARAVSRRSSRSSSGSSSQENARSRFSSRRGRR